MAEGTRKSRVGRLEEDLTAIADTLVEVTETLDEHTATLAEHGRILDDHGRQLSSIRGTQLEQGEMLVEILRRLETG